MIDPLHRSTSPDNGSSQDLSQDNAETRDQATVEAADSAAQQPNWVLETQSLQILESSDDCIKVLDLEGRILFMNRGGQRLLGIQDITPFLNTSWVSFWQEEERQATMDAIARAAAGEVCSFQNYCLTLNGEAKWWDNKISPILGADGSVERLLCISQDITERIRIEDERQQTEAALRIFEEQFRLFTTACSDSVYKMSADWGEMRLLEGKTFLVSTQHPNRTWLEQYVPVDDQSQVMAAIAEAIRTKSTFELEHRVIQLDGTIGWTLSRAIPLLNDQNEIVEWLGAASDVTARKQVELNAELLAVITQDMTEVTYVEGIIQIVGELLNRYLHVSNCAFVEVNESAEVATIRHSWHQSDVPDLVGRYHLSEFVTKAFFQTARLGQTIIVRDVITDPRIADPERFTALKIGSFINVPLIRNDAWKFTLGIYHPTPYNWRNDEINLMRELANRIWMKLERTRVEIALRQNQEMFSALVGNAPFGVYMIDAEFRLHQANQTAIATFNIDPLIGRDLAEALRTIWQEPFATEAIDHFRHTLATGESYYSPSMTEDRADIEEIQSYDWQLHRITLPDGSDGVVCYFYNLSEIKRAEAIVRHNGDRDAFLVTLNDALRPLTDAAEIQAVAARILGEFLEATRVIYIEVDSEGEEVIVRCNYVNGVAELSGRYHLEDYRRNLMADHQAGQTQVVSDIPGNPKYTDAEKARYREIDIAAHIDVPLIKNNQFVALLAAQQSTPRPWTDIEVKLVEETAERTWAAVERARVETVLRESEEKYRSLFESIDTGFCLIEVLFDENGQPFDYRFLEANPAFETQTGLVDAIGKTVRELVPRHETHWFEIYGRIALTGIPERFENAAQELGRFYDVYAFRMGEPQERKVAVLFNDISKRKQVEAALSDDLRDTQLLRDLSARLIMEDNIQVLYDAIVSAAITLTRADAGSIQALDESAQELVLLATQGIDRTVTDHFQRVTASSITSCRAVLATGQRTFVNFDVPASEDPDGSLRLHLNTGLVCAQSTPLISRSGRRIGIVSTYWRKPYRPSDRELRFLDLLARQAADLLKQRQITAEREHLFAREQAAREEADRANRIKDEFLAVLSHELRSPLNPILGWTHLLQTGNLNAVRQQEALATIERNAKLQTQLIEDLLDISRILQGKLSLTVTPVSLPFVISAAVETVRLAAEARTIQIVLDVAEVAPVAGDAARLQQVVWNLLTNAVKFTPDGGQVTVELRQYGRQAQIRVMDTGKGISPQFLPHVFEYFLQEDGSTTRKFGGLGLGLAIARQIVQMHGGRIWAESQGEGQGATFIVQLPTMPQRVVVSEPNQPQSKIEIPLAGIQILLVDDEPDTREFQAFLLEQNGARVTAVASGIEALQALEQSLPDVLVSDIGMADMNGYMLLQQIRSRPFGQGGKIPAIALTAYAAEIDQQRALQVGFQRHITKPVEPEVLVKAIAEVVDRSSL